MARQQPAYDVTDDLELIEAAQDGSVDAFTELVHGYREGLFRFLLTRCSNHADAEDALQDTFINAYRYIRSYDPQWRFSTWIYRIAIRNAARLKLPQVQELGEIGDEESDPLQHCIANSERQNLWQSARRLLTDEVFTAMWLRYVEDMSVNDISAVLKRSVSWTKVNLMRGRRSLDVELNKEATTAKSEAYG